MKIIKYYFVHDPKIAEADVVDSDFGMFIRITDEPMANLLEIALKENKKLRKRVSILEAEKHDKQSEQTK